MEFSNQVRKYFYLKAARDRRPIGGTFELTPCCNMNCAMCYIRTTEGEMRKMGQLLTAAQWIDLGKQCVEQGMLFLLLTGGEPMVRKDFFEIYDGMREMGLLISVNSNGSMLQGEILERFLKNPGITWPLFFTGVYYLAFNGVLTVLFNQIEKKLSFYKV